MREKISLRQWVEISSTHCESEKSERIEKNQSCPTIRISHKQLLAKNFTGVESGLNNIIMENVHKPNHESLLTQTSHRNLHIYRQGNSKNAIWSNTDTDQMRSNTLRYTNWKTLPRILTIFDFIHPSIIFRLFQIIILLKLFFWIAFWLLLALVFRIVTIWQHRSEILVALVRRTNQDEVGTGTPSTHDGNDKHIHCVPELYAIPNFCDNFGNI